MKEGDYVVMLDDLKARWNKNTEPLNELRDSL